MHDRAIVSSRRRFAWQLRFGPSVFFPPTSSAKSREEKRREKKRGGARVHGPLGAWQISATPARWSLRLNFSGRYPSLFLSSLSRYPSTSFRRRVLAHDTNTHTRTVDNTKAPFACHTRPSRFALCRMIWIFRTGRRSYDTLVPSDFVPLARG